MKIKIPFFLFWISHPLWALLPAEHRVLMMPMNCAELIPDNAPFLEFFEAIARGNVTNEPKFSKRVFTLIALRHKLTDENVWIQNENPIDILIRKTICFYREQREPLKSILFDDRQFLQFLKKGISDLENKIQDAVLNIEMQKQTRKEFENRLQKHDALIQSLEKAAQSDAARQYERLSRDAKRRIGGRP